MTRCLWCKGRIMPWQRVYFVKLALRRNIWHRDCRKAFESMLERDREQMQAAVRVIRDRCPDCGQPRHPRPRYHQEQLRAAEEDRL